ncbi:hypothetical protein RJ640_019340 [Escallonia rubra]|uniref:GAG-pre-integrase domain-containing protein n=2 Tax=Escallonia rubra TaxID=112253 RepID=A0AA88RLL9_9ASTE|nr:hypothetical protein RJ640_019340 [Escallonia rubra]
MVAALGKKNSDFPLVSSAIAKHGYHGRATVKLVSGGHGYCKDNHGLMLVECVSSCLGEESEGESELRLTNQDVKCLSVISETSWLWHRRLGHMHMENLKDISSKELLRGLPKIKFEKDKVCDACQMGKQKKVSHKPKKMVSTSRP